MAQSCFRIGSFDAVVIQYSGLPVNRELVLSLLNAGAHHARDLAEVPHHEA